MDIPKIISIDDHVIEPADVWQNRLPAKYREVGPRVIQERGKMQFVGGVFSYEPSDEGELCDWWLYEDKRVPQTRLSAAAGFSREEVKVTGITYEEMRDGCYDPVARLSDMDMNHTEAQMSFPSFPRFCGQTFMEADDKVLSDLCVKAYNDWMVEEWCAGSEGRLIPLTIVQLWDAELAAAEVHRNAERGVRAVCFSEIPPYLNLPSIHTDYWEPFFRACEETGTVINMHIGSSSKMPSTSADAPAAVGSTLTFGNAMSSMADWLFSGWLERLPTLKLAYSEGQIGWIPYILERADNVWEENRAWGGFGENVPEPPSTYYYRQIYGCFFDDKYGLDNLEKVGVDNICFETDYPHSDSTWPHSKEVAEKLMGHLPEDVIYKLMRGNAIEMLGLDFDK
ncbi:MAG: amidohydrolase [Candidatus Microthrix sp.]|jgi:predicted TIM-barrel fold metal-dependent hydrolase|uniref:Amidohydrolase n=1 Tax=Candidatus Neomicrothrix subdominans TaxID=2954438 RepID=A0A936TF97_9ACTN|nr:amidohydrolase family protein [Candidatus Microthrix sp.]MBK9297852.1 amidohydrolase [Candidatus Microthrix subdominans]MBK6437313.1 amidohydrolase [Candidatus Microthrix sp.]MBK6969742.1 amidohydrolase [Candidatus Microthrix sp.]MBK7166869.1 amidohydrolase [Candidatus Microthrix sp.]MBK9559375.1 amidohydrolase [Candidatus Microthrix sp.]